MCRHCGAPTSWFSRKLFVHRNTITAIGVTVALTGGVLSFLFLTGQNRTIQTQLDIQKQLVEEQFRPRISFYINTASSSNDTLNFVYKVKNEGSNKASKLTWSLIGRYPDGTVVADTSIEQADINASYPVYDFPVRIKHINQDTVFLHAIIEYTWERFNSSYVETNFAKLAKNRDSVVSEWTVTNITKSIFPK